MHKLVSWCGGYEFEDVICSIDDADLFAPAPAHAGYPTHFRFANRLARSAGIHSINPGVKASPLKQEYDLFFAYCLAPRDLLALNAVKNWRERCRTAVCLIAEFWVGSLSELKGHLKLLSQFDHVCLHFASSVQPVADVITTPCHHLLPGVDAIRFNPYPDPPPRTVDVFNMGRRSDLTHRALLDLVERENLFYIYDTIKSVEAMHPQEHRSLMINLIKRSRYFIVNAAKIDRASETRGQSEVGYRFVEGAAGGAIMVGTPPDSEAFRRTFDWQDAVVAIPFDTQNIGEILKDLDAREGHLTEVRRESIKRALGEFDWTYRWREILELAQLEPTQALVQREQRLKSLADDLSVLGPGRRLQNA